MIHGSELDGRHARRLSNRQDVVQSLVELFREGVYTPTAAEIAERAGLSTRSLFRYFDDLDDLVGEAIAHQVATAEPLLEVPAQPADPTPVKVERVVTNRVRQYEALAPTARAARAVASRRPNVSEWIAAGRRLRRDQIRQLFGPELAAMGDKQGADTLAAADALTSFETYELLRHDQGLSQRRAEAVLAHGLSALLLGEATSSGSQ